ncbi:hypothetical protein SODALDRAFT_381156 [Sodiomyces alkalinus F11]|uniref:Uncharacterized protein n=1 Tax=Sodiomyces alkalinus (strain CBS 110278 / VKM F-3762 / F11) TaxID=1314773 RepID=A0A3N2PMX6_SODAK|nr:hypothetical protein SODALDRAFT_381156 [Sodiomyces alkalinus F11]ROT35873.1 hypothetical protein SODALDRAFT_381156 [Sodiomyces alkalinus F11]
MNGGFLRRCGGAAAPRATIERARYWGDPRVLLWAVLGGLGPEGPLLSLLKNPTNPLGRATVCPHGLDRMQYRSTLVFLDYASPARRRPDHTDLSITPTDQPTNHISTSSTFILSIRGYASTRLLSRHPHISAIHSKSVPRHTPTLSADLLPELTLHLHRPPATGPRSPPRVQPFCLPISSMNPPLNDMDDAARLIGDLHQKLSSLDSKVAAYRQEMALEFTRYSRDLLKDVPQAISARVHIAVADLLPQYPAVGPALQESVSYSDSDSSLSLGTDTGNGTDTAASTDTARAPSTSSSSPFPSKTDSDTDTAATVPAISPAPASASASASVSASASAAASTLDSLSDAEWLAAPTANSPFSTPHAITPAAAAAAAAAAKSTSTGSPRASTADRDRELHGLFTPAFLPLLQASPALAMPLFPPSPASPSSSRDSLDATIHPPADNMGEVDKELGSKENQSQTSATLHPSSRPPPSRRTTDDTSSCGTAEQGESSVRRRSALRRSSTGSKGPLSPRRVRFEFEGIEVLPTSSPESSDVSFIQSHSLPSTFSRAGAAPPENEVIVDEDAVSAESILGPDEESEPPPKKVSSSQALRALSRTPLDTNTVWTVVNADSPELASERNSPRNISPGSSKGSLPESPMHSGSSPRRPKKPLKSPPPEPQDPADDYDDGDSSDDDFLAMAKPKSSANKSSIASPRSLSPLRQQPTPPALPDLERTASTSVSRSTASPREITKPTAGLISSVVHDEDEGIFDFEGATPAKPQRAPEPVQDEMEEDEATTPEPEPVPTALSSSPSVPIAKPETPAATHLTYGTVGSFKGRPVTVSVVTNPEVYAQAASLGDVNTFVGGLDGSTGADEGDLASYRASVGQALYSGTPRSLTERMLMEDAQAQRRAAAQGRS